MKGWSLAIERNRYYDSVFLMAVARRLSDLEGIEEAAALMGTPANKETLLGMGAEARPIADAGPNDLIIALRGDRDVISGVLQDIDAWLVRPTSALGSSTAVSLADAMSRQAGSNLAVISVPGEYAAAEADAALERGMNVFLFSDHVSVEDEVALKKKASEMGLIVMGPDCGTALIGGAGIGFANVVRRGPIGVVAASGTGLQEFTCLVHRSGSGISHGLGTGGRDLSGDVGGLSTLAAIDVLEENAETKVIAIISKPPGETTLHVIEDRLNRSAKPSVACFVGLDSAPAEEDRSFAICGTIDEAVAAALRLAGADGAKQTPRDHDRHATLARNEAARMAADQVYVRGLFAGGTFCYQAQYVLRNAGIALHSNAPLSGVQLLDDPTVGIENSLVDMGADEFTVGTPHPMIDATQRAKRILAEAQDPQVAVLLLDFILGFNASPDPAGDLQGAIRSARQTAKTGGRHLTVVASVCGTAEDPQGLAGQIKILEEVRVHTFASNVEASTFARDVVLRRATGGE